LVITMAFLTCDIWGFHCGDFADYCLLGCDNVYSGTYFPKFWRNLLPLFISTLKVGTVRSSEAFTKYLPGCTASVSRTQ
jgi:hypothetical protein